MLLPETQDTEYPRQEGFLKVTGAAAYTSETQIPGLVHAVLVKSTVASGEVVQIDTKEAEQSAEWVTVLTAQSFPRLRPARVLLDPGKDGDLSGGGAGQQHLPLQDGEIRYRGQDVAVVLAETLEQARWAASLVKVHYRESPKQTREPFSPGKAWAEEADTVRGDFATGWKEGPVRIDQTYGTATQHHVTMEPHATVALWEGAALTIYESSTWVYGTRKTLAAWFGISEDAIRVRQSFVGGSFGSKGPTWPHVAIAVGAALVIGRPVCLALSRPQTFVSNGHRPPIQHHVRLAAKADGTLTAISHTAEAETAVFDTRVVAPVTKTSKKLYACANCETRYRLVHRNVPGPFTMRGPGETPGLFALESAMDELAYRLEMDPVELRLRNEAPFDPETGKPWSSRGLRECLETGAQRFGWTKRNPRPASRRERGRLFGTGVASMAYDAKMVAAQARVRLYKNGLVSVASSTSEPGTGATTMMMQIAAETLAIPFDQVRCEWGDTDLPMAPLAAGSQTTASVGTAVENACLDLRRRQKEDQGLGSEDYIEGIGHAEPSPAHKQHTCYSFGAHFAEISVDENLGNVRVERYLGVFAAGRILNSKAAHSQLLGGIIWGIGMALFEGTKRDMARGSYVNDNLADYLVPTNADIPNIDAFFLPEHDRTVNSLGVKGIGEIGTIGSAAAIANAVYHATGKRARELPITLERLL